MIKTALDFGTLVKTARKAKGWTQSELANRCGTGDRFIGDLENGKPTCQIGKALVVAREVGIDLVDANTTKHDVSQAIIDELSHLPRYGAD